MRAVFASILLLIGLSLSAAGDSKEERAEKERCLTLSALTDDQPSSARRGVLVKVTVKNSCSRDFPGLDTWFKVFAINRRKGGVSGTETNRFRSTIPGHGFLETHVALICDAEERYDFRVELWP